MCIWCGGRATDVDHIDGLGPLGPRGYDPGNCRALCHSCHSWRTARDQSGWVRSEEPAVVESLDAPTSDM